MKGWAIRNASRLIEAAGAKDYLVEAGGDIQSWGKAADGTDWKIGIRHPFNDREIIKTVRPLGRGIATSGTYARGDHIYNPHQPGHPIAMGKRGIYFIKEIPRLEGYAIDMNGVATQTTGFGAFVVP